MKKKTFRERYGLLTKQEEVKKEIADLIEESAKEKKKTTKKKVK